MTTLIGIKASKGEEGVILASDVSATRTIWKPQGDVAQRQQTRYEEQKIHVDDKRELAISMSGVYDSYYTDFLSAVLNGKVNVKRAVEKKFFKELLGLNLKRWDGKNPGSDCSNTLLIATRFGEPKLFGCYPLGKVEEVPWATSGSGSEYAIEYISKQGKLIPGRLTLKEGIDLTVNALDEASQDIYTGGLDLVVVKKDCILEYGKEIRDSIANARAKTIKKIRGS